MTRAKSEFDGSSLRKRITLTRQSACAQATRLLTTLALIMTFGYFLPAGENMTIMGPQKVHAASASDKRFRQWVERLWPSARRNGVSRKTFNTAFRGVRPDPEVIRSAHYQPEFVRPIWDYMSSATSNQRVTVGQDMLRKNKRLLDRLENRYKVDRHTIVAIWGMESNYGLTKGDKNVIQSLATLAYRDRRRRRFGRQQLLSALRILQKGDIKATDMKGSWAGAMGHTQFIPTTYAAYAIDYDRDGKRDIWHSSKDALASTANYLHRSGWRGGQTWGYEVKLPKRMKHARTRIKRRKTLRYWKKSGLKRVGGKKFPRLNDKAALFLPAGRNGPAFLVLKNFRAILRYNNANTYALAVGHLSDRLRGAGGFVKSWPTKHKPLARDERLELQKLLTAKGFDTGGTDGVFGNDTLRALRKYQKSRGLKVDGWPSARILKKLRNDS
ncbi:MAG: lytic murein transglycosylase [bacterium]|nr:lytic murein transglycosylase [bacterium]